jgi:hypothetical protein
MAEVQAQRTVAEARLRQGSGRQRMTTEEITRVVSSLRELMSVLAAADPADKAQIYSQLGLALTYHPGSQTVRAEARPLPMYVRKCPRGIDPYPHSALRATAPILISSRRTGRMLSDVQKRCLPPRAVAGPESLRAQKQA